MIRRTSVSSLAAIAIAVVIPAFSSAALAGGSSKPAGASAPEMIANHTSTMGPVEMPGIAIKNFGLVDGKIFRGGQPEKTDYAALKSIGVTTIVDLREDSKSWAKGAAEAAGLKYVNIRMKDGSEPTDAQAAEFVKLIDDPSTGVAYVHCAGGRHRTGSMVAVYRMARDGWNADKAYQEMLDYDFYTRWGHEGFKTYVFDYYQRMTSNPASVPVAYVAPSPATVAGAAGSDQK
jgi:protein tyrosine/serine phosphatase